jgi:hypothetical protein
VGSRHGVAIDKVFQQKCYLFLARCVLGLVNDCLTPLAQPRTRSESARGWAEACDDHRLI